MKDDQTFIEEWEKVEQYVQEHFKKSPSVEAILFLIGVQELGQGPNDFSKEQKQELMHIATCKVLSFSGYYVLTGLDSEGWPLWSKKDEVPALSLNDQEQFIKWHIIRYFESIKLI